MLGGKVARVGSGRPLPGWLLAKHLPPPTIDHVPHYLLHANYSLHPCPIPTPHHVSPPNPICGLPPSHQLHYETLQQEVEQTLTNLMQSVGIAEFSQEALRRSGMIKGSPEDVTATLLNFQTINTSFADQALDCRLIAARRVALLPIASTAPASPSPTAASR